ncbi:VolA/Pla-1 family phospholipase [Colwelliaceae bacterium MEBiC 14330]
MKKLALSLAIVSALGLSACDSESIEDVKQQVEENGSQVEPLARIVYDPSNGVLSAPNDLLFSGSQDGTLAIPVEDPTNYADPQVAINALDGWSVSTPFVLAVDFPAGVSFDAASVANPAAVKIYETVMGGDASDPECAEVTRGLACKVVGELTFGVDYVAQAQGNNIAVIPLKPFKGKTGYVVALTNHLKDSNGKSVAGSLTYEAVRQDITTNPLATESQLLLQGIVNSMENAIVNAGADKDSLIYTMAMTTQSTTDALDAVKGIMASGVPAMVENAMAGVPAISMLDTGLTVADILGDSIPPESIPLFSTAKYLRGSITLPYYLAVPTEDDPYAPRTDWWRALCDSGAMLAGLAAMDPSAIPPDAISPTDAACMNFGLRDLGIDTERNITKFNPIPATRAMMDVEVQMTTPNVAVANGVRASIGLAALEKPENGWPLVILQHGLSGNKEQMLALTGALSVYGIASVAIDAPLHGSRGFDINNDGDTTDAEDINGSLNTLDYINLNTLLAGRDNFRQTIADILGLRLGLNFTGAADTTGTPVDLMIDTSNVHYFGISLGGIMGISTTAMSNTPLDPQVDALFKMQTSSLSVPGLMLANFGIESPAFSGLVKSNLVYASSADFRAAVAATLGDDYTQEQLTAFYNAFYDNLSDQGKAELDATFASFTFAAQTVTDTGDPISYITNLAATDTPVMITEVIGNGSDNLPDQVVINTTPNTPMGGTEPAIRLLELPSVSTTTQDEAGVSGAVRFLFGHHGSSLTPSPIPGVAPDAMMTARATQEMQNQLVTYILTMGQTIAVIDEEIVQ